MCATFSSSSSPSRSALCLTSPSQLGHTAAVYVAKFSPRDSLVASAGFDRTLRLWEGSYPYSQVACLEGHRQLISDLCWAPDGRSLLSASFDQVSVSVRVSVGLNSLRVSCLLVFAECTAEQSRVGQGRAGCVLCWTGRLHERTACDWLHESAQVVLLLPLARRS